MAANTTTLEVHGPRQVATRALLDIDGAEQVPLSADRPYLMVRLGRAEAVALWLEAQQRTVITVYENDSAMPAAAAVFARLVARMPRFEIRHEADEFRFQFSWAN